MPDDDRLTRRLEALGRSERGQLTQERLASIEAKATVAITLDDPSSVTTSRLRRSAPTVLAVAALLVLFVVAAAWFTGGTALTVQAAEGSVVIEFPDGRSLDASVGLDLPDGSFVDVGEGGSVRLGDDELGPGRYVVRDGRAVPDRTATAPTSTTSTTTPRSAIDGDRPADRTSPTSTSITPARPGTTVPSDRPPPSTSPSDRPTSTTLDVRPTTTVDRRTTTTTVGDGTVPTTTTTTTTTTITRTTDRPSSTTTTMQPRTTTTSSSIPSDRLGDGTGR